MLVGWVFGLVFCVLFFFNEKKHPLSQDGGWICTKVERFFFASLSCLFLNSSSFLPPSVQP